MDLLDQVIDQIGERATLIELSAWLSDDTIRDFVRDMINDYDLDIELDD